MYLYAQRNLSMALKSQPCGESSFALMAAMKILSINFPNEQNDLIRSRDDCQYAGTDCSQYAGACCSDHAAAMTPSVHPASNFIEERSKCHHRGISSSCSNLPGLYSYI